MENIFQQQFVASSPTGIFMDSFSQYVHTVDNFLKIQTTFSESIGEISSFKNSVVFSTCKMLLD